MLSILSLTSLTCPESTSIPLINFIFITCKSDFSLCLAYNIASTSAVIFSIFLAILTSRLSSMYLIVPLISSLRPSILSLPFTPASSSYFATWSYASFISFLISSLEKKFSGSKVSYSPDSESSSLSSSTVG